MKELPLPSIASLRAIAALRSPHLALVRPARIGLGFESTGANQKSLAEVEELLGGPGRLSLPYSLRWLLDVMTGLGVLHRTLGFVHGELQPEHAVLGEDGVGRLIPVVRAHWVRGEERAPERLYYLAPEKLLGDRLDVRSDVFSVGVMLWEALAGQPLLEAHAVDDIIARLMGGGIPHARPPEGEAWTLPLADIAERAISVDPARRFASVAEMRDALQNACSRYLASAPGMAELFMSPEQRARSYVRESRPPDSSELDAAAERLARSSMISSVDLEVEEPTEPALAPAPTVASAPAPAPTVAFAPAPAPAFASAPASAPAPVFASAPAAAPAPFKNVHGQTLVGVAPPFIERDASARMNVTRPVGTPLPVITPRTSAPPSHSELDRAPESPRPPTLSPMVAPQPPQPRLVEPSFELVTPRKRPSGVWLVLGAAAAIAAFAARPWLAEQLAAATGQSDAPAPSFEPAAAPAELTPPSADPVAKDAAPSASASPDAVGIASTPPSPTDRGGPRPRLPGREQRQVIGHERVRAASPPPVERRQRVAVPRAPEHEIEPKAATPSLVEAPPPPPSAPAPRPKATTTADDRYGI
ncbi:MAG TPA: protein kinase [Polyangiaceae bacterium]